MDKTELSVLPHDARRRGAGYRVQGVCAYTANTFQFY
jgi:hypothetical protein